MMKQNKGVTLIALVITIVVLLILAGTTIAMLTGDNGIIARAAKAKEETDKAASEEEAGLQRTLQEIASRVPSVEGYNDIKKVNSPKLAEGMIPVKWNTSKNVWVVCDENDPTWYNYDSKEWANVMLSDGTYKYGEVTEGQKVKDEDLGSMYVWIPRYAYTIPHANNENKINVTFVKGNTNEGVNGEIFTTDESVDTTSTKLIHPGFNLGGSPLTGIWVAKFEASGVDDNGNAVGNASKGSKNQTYGPSTNTIAQSLPNKISWRHISIGECEQRSMEVATKDSFGLKNANSHLIKNSEWGAVAYLCYSDYGSVPQINAAGTVKTTPYWYTYNLYTGQGPSANGDIGRYEKKDDSNNYSTTNGILASTTGNTTGVYDMNGGAWEYVAAYIDNGNSNLNAGGKYFINRQLNEAYTSLWDKYEASQEEKDNQIQIDKQTTLTQSELWDNTNKKIEIKYQNARKRLTQAVFDGMAKYKGIGVNEMTTTFSYYTAYQNTNGDYTRGWFIDPEVAAAEKTKEQYIPGVARSWDNDLIRIGHSSIPFVARGGSFHYGGNAGVFCSGAYSGYGSYHNGFRPVVVV